MRAPYWLTCVTAGIAGAVAINFYLIVAEVLVLHTATVLTVSQWDASNLLGLAAFDGGMRTAAIGFCMHLVVSTIWATLFALVALRMPIIMKNPLISGIIFGLVVMSVMLLVIVPLGHAPLAHVRLSVWIDRAVAHTLFFGVPVAWIVSKLGVRA